MIGVCVCVTRGRNENSVQYLVSKYGRGDTICKTYSADRSTVLELIIRIIQDVKIPTGFTWPEMRTKDGLL
jgi:hypothetical protein